MFKNALAQLFRDNKNKGAALRVVAEDDDSASIYVYDAIGWYGIEAADFVRDLNAIKASTIHLRIDCPGGDAFAARAMKTALEQHPAKVIAHIDGLAASAASFLMLGADEIEISEGAFVMIHNAWTIAVGDWQEMEKQGEVLKKIDTSMRKDYASRGTKSEDEFREMMDDETWFDASEAVEAGLADRVFKPESKVENRFDLTVYSNAPKALTEKPDEPDVDAVYAHQLRRLEAMERLAA